jgi:8-oxo-dGTP pyrophosphatase MutT (NUDIX family)
VKNKGAGVIFLCNQDVLLLKNPKNVWEIPGGKKDLKEKYALAAKRETKEEIGKWPGGKIVAKFLYEDHKNKFKIYVVFVPEKFLCSLSDEHKSYNWFDIKKLPQNIHKKILGSLDILKNKINR